MQVASSSEMLTHIDFTFKDEDDNYETTHKICLKTDGNVGG